MLSDRPGEVLSNANARRGSARVSIDPNVILAATLALVGIGAVFFVLSRRKTEKPGSGEKPRRRERPFELCCSLCQARSQLVPSELNEVSPAEVALLVSQVPAMVGRPVRDVHCPKCGASHYFGADTDPPTWVAVNIFEPEAKTNLCGQCRKPLVKPPWPEGKYDGRIFDAPGLLARHGLVCKRCGAVSCVECCQSATRNRTEDGSYLCPRCNRGPIETIYHF